MNPAASTNCIMNIKGLLPINSLAALKVPDPPNNVRLIQRCINKKNIRNRPVRDIMNFLTIDEVKKLPLLLMEYYFLVTDDKVISYKA